jgi:hypothetical protein
VANPAAKSLAKRGSGGAAGEKRAALRPPSSLVDSRLEYLRGGMRSLEPFRRAFASAREAGVSPTRVATTGVYPGGRFPPIRVDVEASGRMHLNDGRHRYLAAREAGARAIAARVVLYGPRGGVRSDEVRVLRLR